MADALGQLDFSAARAGWRRWSPSNAIPLGRASSRAGSWDTRPTQETNWLWLLPLLWFGWQLISATQTVDADLTAATLWQFFGCVACYFIGALILKRETALRWLLVGVLAAFAFCLVRAVDQRLVEFPQSHQLLVEGERDGWTNVPPAMLLEMKQEQVVITTNGVDVANPVVLKKFARAGSWARWFIPTRWPGRFCCCCRWR